MRLFPRLTRSAPAAPASAGPGETVDGIHLRELTLATTLLLVRIHSPLFETRPYDIEEWLRTLYLLSIPAAQGLAAIEQQTLALDALLWADRFGPRTYERLLAAAGRLLDRCDPAPSSPTDQ